ncbi:hypothetical protein [Catenulispora pinisilvae]|uniref:hypothetical protein n=1 Tax=Catenulispora pinisilvae TaxID=2705253 RepID=UPI0018927400|nr:hypothetical protein [Catenulispora pinisilvae]
MNETLSAASFLLGGWLLVAVDEAGPSLAYLFHTDSQHAVGQSSSMITSPVSEGAVEAVRSEHWIVSH